MYKNGRRTGSIKALKQQRQPHLKKSLPPVKSREHTALVALGGNLSHAGMTPKHTILAAIAELAGEGLPILHLSNLYETPSYPAGNGPDYVNAAAVVTSRHSQSELEVLTALHRIEALFGRVRQQRWGTRTLDLDLVAVGQTILPNREIFLHWHDLSPSEQRSQSPQELILPHPRMHERAFVLVPLADVAPDWVHPVLGKTVSEMLAALPVAERRDVKALL